jgi:putative transposase
MPRHARIDFAGAFHHLYARGIEKRPIFVDEADREDFRRRILFNLDRFRSVILAWALLSNHFHFLYYSHAGDLAKFMRCLMTGYSISFNRRHKRVGHLFQNRYKSSLIDSNRYLAEIIRYIHLNPLRAGDVSSLRELDDYRWSGHREILRGDRVPWRDFPFIAELFPDLGTGSDVENYRRFMEAGSNSGQSLSSPAAETDGVPGRRLLANEVRIPDGMEEAFRIFSFVADTACRERGRSLDQIQQKSRDSTSSEIRRKILMTCVEDFSVPQKLVCAWLGICEAAGSYQLKKGKAVRNALASPPGAPSAHGPVYHA